VNSLNFLENQLNQQLKDKYQNIVKEFIIAIGLILFVEGLLLAIFPSRIKSILQLIKETPESKLRSLGTIFLVIGFLIIWYIKN
tara:strand:- start:5 stop:256 length:252 start_codon:yes stop_codon:yes gene_type:complete